MGVVIKMADSQGRHTDKHLKKNGWVFYQFGGTPTIISAEKKLGNVSDEDLNDLKKQFRSLGFRVCFEIFEKSKVQKVILQLYKNYNSTDIEEKAGMLLQEIKSVSLYLNQ